ncbi:MAG: hypothetical protein ACE5EW_01690 [Thermoplasmata archaeon]
MPALRMRNPGLAALLVLCLLLTWGAVPFFADFAPPVGQAAGDEVQGEPARCEAIGNNWTACGRASDSDDLYATANATPIEYVRAGGVRGTSFSFDIGSPGTDRLVVVVADEESSGTSLTDVTVDANSCNLVTEADNPSGAGNHQEMWYCDDDDLGASSGLVSVAIVGGNSDWGVHAHLYTQVSQNGPTDAEIEDAAVSATTIEVELVTVPRGGVVVFGAAHGSGGSFDAWGAWTSPLLERTDGPHPNSARLATASEVETTAQTDKTYIATATVSSFNRGTGIVAVWPSKGPGKNDTAWSDFGVDLSPQDSVSRVEVGVEWYRLNERPILNVTVSWDGGSTWALNQTATNKSADDDTLEWLDFSSATAWTPAQLNDTNFRVRVGTNESTALLDYLAVRVTFPPLLNFTLVSSSATADPGDILTLNATVENLSPGATQNHLLEASVDANASYLTSTPAGTYEAGTRTLRWSLPLLLPGEQVSFVWTIRVTPGTPDLARVNTSFRVAYEDATGMPRPALAADTESTVQVPILAPVLGLDRTSAERGNILLAILYFNNTGSGRALRAWANWSLGGHYELVDIFPAQTYNASGAGFDISFTDLLPGPHSLVARLLVIRGLEDGLAMDVNLAWSATDGNGNALSGASQSGAVTLYAPSFTLSLQASGTSVQVGSEFTLDVTVQNRGQAVGSGWLNMTLPPGVAYVSQSGILEFTTTADLVSWRIDSLAPDAQVRVEVRLRAEDGPSLESFVLSVDFTDGQGSPPLTVFSNQIFVRLLGTGGLIPLPWWLFLLPLLVPFAFLGYYLNRRLRHPELRIEEVFVIHKKGILVAHQSRTLTPDRDRDILAAMFKAVQGFVKDAFASGAENTMRGLRFENFNILIEQGTYHYVAVVYQGQENRVLERRVAELSHRIEEEFGALLASWVGDMQELRGIRRLLPVIWGETGGVSVQAGREAIVGTTGVTPPRSPKVVYESRPGKLTWFATPFRQAHGLLSATSSVFRDLIRSKERAPARMIEMLREAGGRVLTLVQGRNAQPPSSHW